MNNVAIDPFERMVRDANEGWLIDWYAPPGDAIPHLLDVLHRANEAARFRFGEGVSPLTPDALVHAFQRNPHKVRAFLQVLGSVASPDILVMVWQILEGGTIATMSLNYSSDGSFHLFVRLTSPSDAARTEDYQSNDIEDAVVLRHLGILKIENQGTFDGFYALNLRH